MIYEVTYQISSKELYLDNESTLIIKAVPLNSFGSAVPFREAPSRYVIDEGNKFVKILENNEEEGFIKIMAVEAPGRVIISVKSVYSLLPTKFEIPIYTNNA